MPPRSLTRLDGHLPIEDHGLIGDGATCALVARDGSIPWLCLPDFDSRPFLAGLLDVERGGSLAVAPVGLREAAQRYVEDTGVLVSELHGPDGVLELTDCMTLRSRRRHRRARVTRTGRAAAPGPTGRSRCWSTPPGPTDLRAPDAHGSVTRR